MKKNRITFFAMELILLVLAAVFCVEDFYSERAGKKSSRNTSGIRRPEMGFSDQRNEAVGKRESYTSGHLQHR
mgnify:CR=1 FL=1